MVAVGGLLTPAVLCPSFAPKRRNPRVSRSAGSALGLASLALAFTAGCSSDFAGKWTGDCVAGVGSRGTSVPVEFEVGRSGRDTLAGMGEFTYNDYTFEGSAEGRVVDDEAVKIDIEGVYGGYVILLELEANIDGEDLEGICTFEDQETLYEGDLTLSPVAEK
jgi:hypothetical protein